MQWKALLREFWGEFQPTCAAAKGLRTQEVYDLLDQVRGRVWVWGCGGVCVVGGAGGWGVEGQRQGMGSRLVAEA